MSPPPSAGQPGSPEEGIEIENAGPHLAFLLLAGASDQTRVVGVVAKHPMTVTAQKPWYLQEILKIRKYKQVIDRQ